jgi:hypothetical protein
VRQTELRGLSARFDSGNDGPFQISSSREVREGWSAASKQPPSVCGGGITTLPPSFFTANEPSRQSVERSRVVFDDLFVLRGGDAAAVF